MAEGARLESVCTLIAYRGFESLPHRHYTKNRFSETVFFFIWLPVSWGFQPNQAYWAISVPSRHVPALALSIAGFLCDEPLEAYPSSAVAMLV